MLTVFMLSVLRWVSSCWMTWQPCDENDRKNVVRCISKLQPRILVSLFLVCFERFEVKKSKNYQLVICLKGDETSWQVLTSYSLAFSNSSSEKKPLFLSSLKKKFCQKVKWSFLKIPSNFTLFGMATSVLTAFVLTTFILTAFVLTMLKLITILLIIGTIFH